MPQESPVNDARIASWIERFGGYRREVGQPEIEAWLRQFRDNRDVGARLLDATEFLTRNDLEVAFREVLGRLPGWSAKETERSGRWFFVSFSASAGESGDSMVHVFRVANQLTHRRFNANFVYKSDLPSLRPGGEDTVIFIDDLSGTGDQAIRAWEENLQELLPERPRVILVVAVAGWKAVERIQERTELELWAHQRLEREDDLFGPECQHFSSTEKEAVLALCRRASRAMPKGYGDCGWLLVFQHRCPNNSVAVLHSSSSRFTGLFPRD